MPVCRGRAQMQGAKKGRRRQRWDRECLMRKDCSEPSRRRTVSNAEQLVRADVPLDAWSDVEKAAKRWQ